METYMYIHFYKVYLFINVYVLNMDFYMLIYTFLYFHIKISTFIYRFMYTYM